MFIPIRYFHLSLKHFICFLFYLEAPRFFSKESWKETIITEGEALYEPCVTIAEPPMNVSWLRNGGVIKQGNVSGVLNFTSINRSHDGIYICLGVNEVATIKRTLSVVVLCKYTKHLTFSAVVLCKYTKHLTFSVVVLCKYTKHLTFSLKRVNTVFVIK